VDVERVWKATIAQGESQRTELKSSFADTRAIIKTLAAMANGDGGSVFVGVNNDRVIVGTQLKGNSLERFAQRLSQNTQPLLPVKIETMCLDDKTVVELSVAPTGHYYSAYGKYRIRIGISDHETTLEALTPVMLQVPMQTLFVGSNPTAPGPDHIARWRPNNHALRALERVREDVEQAIRNV
jgi:predicted HTH transcriptional regulator